jgi:predicted O-methyltransferase YrrM
MFKNFIKCILDDISAIHEMYETNVPFTTAVAQSILDANKDGTILEFGVFQGHTCNSIARAFPNYKVFGFDSFEGLPEKWRDGFDAGAFNTNGRLPWVEKNVSLYKGWFNQTIPQFKSKHSDIDSIDFLHFDCDLYSSTQTIFDELFHLITPQTVVVFDELINYPGFEDHEMLALYEALEKHNKTYSIISHCGERVALYIIDKD